MPKPTYAAILAYADLGGARIERIFVKPRLEQVIRFRRRSGPTNPRALEVTEDELLILLGDANCGRRFLA